MLALSISMNGDEGGEGGGACLYETGIHRNKKLKKRVRERKKFWKLRL